MLFFIHSDLTCRFYLHGMINGRKEPRQTETKEHVDGITARHIPDRIIRILVAHRGSPAREQIRETGAQRDQGDGGHRVLESDHAAEHLGDVWDQHCEDRDHSEGAGEGQPAPDILGRWNESEENLGEKKWSLVFRHILVWMWKSRHEIKIWVIIPREPHKTKW